MDEMKEGPERSKCYFEHFKRQKRVWCSVVTENSTKNKQQQKKTQDTDSNPNRNAGTMDGAPASTVLNLSEYMQGIWEVESFQTVCKSAEE